MFDLFDFNELNSLSVVDLEFMLYSCLNSTFKIYGIKQELSEDAINAFLNESFIEDSRINISQLVKYQSIEFLYLYGFKDGVQSPLRFMTSSV